MTSIKLQYKRWIYSTGTLRNNSKTGTGNKYKKLLNFLKLLPYRYAGSQDSYPEPNLNLLGGIACNCRWRSLHVDVVIYLQACYEIEFICDPKLSNIGILI